jgi:hypothetical protein
MLLASVESSSKSYRILGSRSGCAAGGQVGLESSSPSDSSLLPEYQLECHFRVVARERRNRHQTS